LLFSVGFRRLRPLPSLPPPNEPANIPPAPDGDAETRGEIAALLGEIDILRNRINELTQIDSKVQKLDDVLSRMSLALRLEPVEHEIDKAAKSIPDLIENCRAGLVGPQPKSGGSGGMIWADKYGGLRVLLQNMGKSLSRSLGEEVILTACHNYDVNQMRSVPGMTPLTTPRGNKRIGAFTIRQKQPKKLSRDCRRRYAMPEAKPMTRSGAILTKRRFLLRRLIPRGRRDDSQ
jgi:hypothetical protein